MLKGHLEVLAGLDLTVIVQPDRVHRGFPVNVALKSERVSVVAVHALQLALEDRRKLATLRRRLIATTILHGPRRTGRGSGRRWTTSLTDSGVQIASGRSRFGPCVNRDNGSGLVGTFAVGRSADVLAAVLGEDFRDGQWGDAVFVGHLHNIAGYNFLIKKNSNVNDPS